MAQPRNFAKRAAQFEGTYQAFEESDADVAIISVKHFQEVDPQDLHQAIKTHWPGLADRMRLVAYVRPHGEKILSAFGERIKLGVMKQPLDAERYFSPETIRSAQVFATLLAGLVQAKPRQFKQALQSLRDDAWLKVWSAGSH